MSAIWNDRANVSEQISRMPSWTCEGACAERQRFRKAALQSRLAALDAEAQAAADRRLSHLRTEAEATQAKQDLVGSRLASSLHVTYDSATWITALAYAIMLEGVGCFCWTVWLKPSVATSLAEVAASPVISVGKVTESETRDVGDVTVTQSGDRANDRVKSRTRDDDDFPHGDSGEDLSHTERDLVTDVDRVRDAVRDSRLPLTVKEIRLFLRCGQSHARAVRKQVANEPDGHAASLVQALQPS